MKAVKACAFMLLVTGCGVSPSSQLDEAWNDRNDPANFGMEAPVFDDLPTEGQLPADKYPWSGDYWATRSGGISERWQVKVKNPRLYKDYQYGWYDKVFFMNYFPGLEYTIELLSPAEKYDLLMGRYDFPLSKHERNRQENSVDKKKGDVPKWFGLCHGWAPAVLLEKEPGPVAVMKNPHGIDITFVSSDIKALLSKVYSDYPGRARMLGVRCEEEAKKIKFTHDGRIENTECRDTNPGSFHIVLTDLLGRSDPDDREGFIMDMSSHSEVWNQPITGFKVLSAKRENFFDSDASPHFAPGTVELVHVITQVDYVVEIASSPYPQLSYRDEYTKPMILRYTLELDNQGRIIGGEWAENETHPDFIWKMDSKPNTGEDYLSYSKIQEILRKSWESY